MGNYRETAEGVRVAPLTDGQQKRYRKRSGSLEIHADYRRGEAEVSRSRR